MGEAAAAGDAAGTGDAAAAAAGLAAGLADVVASGELAGTGELAAGEAGAAAAPDDADVAALCAWPAALVGAGEGPPLHAAISPLAPTSRATFKKERRETYIPRAA
jgi:hypothetical protein